MTSTGGEDGFTKGSSGGTTTDQSADINYTIRRGFLLIIHNNKFPYGQKREGSQEDVVALQKFFETKLKFKILLLENKKADEIKETVRKISEGTDFVNFDAFLCAILSHGEGAGFHGIDNEVVSIDDIVSLFKGDKLPRKPKLFFIQACRGKKIDHGTIAYDSPKEGATLPQPPGEPPSSPLKIPSEADILIAHSSCDGYRSHRDIVKGSWFITELVKQLDVPARKNLLDILTHVNYEIAKLSTPDEEKQMPCYQSTLTKHIYFEI